MTQTWTCPSCKTDNKSARVYCFICETKLGHECPNCETIMPRGLAQCSACDVHLEKEIALAIQNEQKQWKNMQGANKEWAIGQFQGVVNEFSQSKLRQRLIRAWALVIMYSSLGIGLIITIIFGTQIINNFFFTLISYAALGIVLRVLIVFIYRNGRYILNYGREKTERNQRFTTVVKMSKDAVKDFKAQSFTEQPFETSSAYKKLRAKGWVR